jgi:hypothetical protein
MKKHHLFLLVVCLLLVASLAFPATSLQTNATPTTHAITYEVSDVNDFPGKVVEGDTLYVKKIMDQLSEKEGKKISLKIFKKVTGQAPTPFPFDETPVWLKGSTDDIAQEYYALPPLKVGTYDFIITSIRTSGGGIQEKPVVTNREVEVISKNNVVEAKKIREEGDNDT